MKSKHAVMSTTGSRFVVAFVVGVAFAGALAPTQAFARESDDDSLPGRDAAGSGAVDGSTSLRKTCPPGEVWVCTYEGLHGQRICGCEVDNDN